MRKSTDSGAKLAECSLIIGTCCRVQVFSLILDSSVGLSVSIQSTGDLVSGIPGSNPAFSRGTQLVSFRFEYRLPVPEHRNWQQNVCMYVCMYDGWMNGLMGGWMDGWTDGRMDGWMLGWMDECISELCIWCCTIVHQRKAMADVNILTFCLKIHLAAILQ